MTEVAEIEAGFPPENHGREVGEIDENGVKEKHQ